MNTQNKILLGIGSFVGIMLLVGWIAINEPARMEVFTQQWQGRSIERGAELFLNHCTECHGLDGLGLPGAAPALKNPMLFLSRNPAKEMNDRLVAQTRERTNLEKALVTYQENLTQAAELQQKLSAAPEGSDERKEIQAQLDEVNAAIRLFDPNTQARIDELSLQIAEAQAELDVLVAEGWDPRRDVRLAELGWAGSLSDYLHSTLVAGRPTSIAYWPRAMPPWAQTSGGPMRPDEIDNLVAFLMNYEDQALRLTPNDLKQDFKLPGEGGLAAAVDKEVLGTDVDVSTLDLEGGDPAAGEQKYVQYACAGCHTTPGGAAFSFAPTVGTWQRIVNIRMNDPQVRELHDTPEAYVAASIIHPNEYIVPGGTAGVMPSNLGDMLDLQDLKDLIAFIKTQ